MTSQFLLKIMITIRTQLLLISFLNKTFLKKSGIAPRVYNKTII